MPRAKSDKPRGRMSSYAYFVQTCRDEHRKKHPDETMSFADFSKKCSDRWKVMNEKEKKRFIDLADKDKMRFESEMETYVPPPGAKGGRGGRKGKAKKDPKAPKRSLSAFFCFCNDERPKIRAMNPGYTVGDVAKELGRMWGECSEQSKKKYVALAEKDKERYIREMEAYKNGVSAAPAAAEDDEDETDSDE